MKLFEIESAVLSKYAPGLEAQLQEVGLTRLEAESSCGIGLFRMSGSPKLLVPREHGGLGASALDALRFQIALASRAPSLALSTTMHQYKVATLAEMGKSQDLCGVLCRFAAENLLVASGGSEGIPGKSLFAPSVTARESGAGIVVSGTKKPCCLAWSMDLLSVMIASSPESRYGGELLNVLIDARHPSIKRTKFWMNPVLQAAENDAITLEDTPVDPAYIFPVGTPENAQPFSVAALVWFELLATGSYLGMAMRMVDMVMQEGRGTSEQLAGIAFRYETILAGLEHVAEKVDAGGLSDQLLSRIIKVRFAAQEFIAGVTSQAFELLGGLAFGKSGEAGLLALSSRALAFHPPTLGRMHEILAGELAGEPFRLV